MLCVNRMFNLSQNYFCVCLFIPCDLRSNIFSEQTVFDSFSNFSPIVLGRRSLSHSFASFTRCRVDFQKTPTKNCRINLSVLGEFSICYLNQKPKVSFVFNSKLTCIMVFVDLSSASHTSGNIHWSRWRCNEQHHWTLQGGN